MTTLLPGLILGFPPVRAGTREEGFTQRPSGREDGTRRRHRVGVGQTDRDFSRPSQPCPERSIVLHQTHRPPTCATTAIGTPPPSNRDQRTEASRTKEDPKTEEWRGIGHAGGNHLHRQRRYQSGHADEGHTRPTWPGQAQTHLARAREAPVGMLHDTRRHHNHAQLRPPALPTGSGSSARNRPIETQMGPKGPGSGPEGHHQALPRRPHD
jgi:hypothetical protein